MNTTGPPATPRPDIHPLSALLRRYSYAYTASHDISVCPSLMVNDYQLQMGPFTAQGRDSSYIPATEKQYRQYPGLGFTVHDLINNGERAALRFSEHGRSVLSDRTSCWRGISLYRWDGTRLTHCNVEQDYQSRTRQIVEGEPDHVPHPAIDPWTQPVEPPADSTNAIVHGYLQKSSILTDHHLVVDAEDAYAGDPRIRLDEATVNLTDLFTAGSRAAVQLSIIGAYRGGLGQGFQDVVGAPAILYATGILQIAEGRVSGHLVTDRLALSRRLHPKPADGKTDPAASSM